MIHIKKTLRCNIIKTVLGREKTAVVKRTFRKIFKEEKTDVDEKKKENNAVDIEKDIEVFKLIYC